MPPYSATNTIHNTQKEVLKHNLLHYYKDHDKLHKMLRIINGTGEPKISLRIVDWFVTNYSKKYYTVYDLNVSDEEDPIRFKVYNDYKLELKSYSKRRFDPFCRWERIYIPYDSEKYMETTLGQLNFFKWAIENQIIEYIEQNYDDILVDMNARNSSAKRKHSLKNSTESSLDSREVTDLDVMDDDIERVPLANNGDNGKTRKKREELSISACKCIKKEMVKIVVKFN